MRFYKKRTLENKIKQLFYVQLPLFLVFLFMLNCTIEHLKTVDINKKYIKEFYKSKEVADVVDSQESAVSDASPEQSEASNSQSVLSPVQETIKRISDKYDIDWKMVYAVCLVETGCSPNPDCKSAGKCDGGESVGAYQIHLPSHPDITEKQAMDFEWATEWTIKHCEKYKNDKKLFAICHNGIGKYPRNEWYAQRFFDEYYQL